MIWNRRRKMLDCAYMKVLQKVCIPEAHGAVQSRGMDVLACRCTLLRVCGYTHKLSLPCPKHVLSHWAFADFGSH